MNMVRIGLAICFACPSFVKVAIRNSSSVCPLRGGACLAEHPRFPEWGLNLDCVIAFIKGGDFKLLEIRADSAAFGFNDLIVLNAYKKIFRSHDVYELSWWDSGFTGDCRAGIC